MLNSLIPLSLGPTDVPPPADPFDYFYNLTLEAPYQNLAISSANTKDVFTKTGNALNLVAGNFDNVDYDITLRTPSRSRTRTPES